MVCRRPGVYNSVGVVLMEYVFSANTFIMLMCLTVIFLIFSSLCCIYFFFSLYRYLKGVGI